MFNITYIKLFQIVSLAIVLLPINCLIAKAFVDPTRPPGATTQQQVFSSVRKNSPWSLSSTLIASKRRIATINGKLLRPGERVNGAILIDIQAWNVTLKKNNKTFKIYMFKKPKIIKANR